MKHKRSIIAGVATVLGIGSAATLGITTANAAITASTPEVTRTATVSVDEDGNLTRSGDLSDEAGLGFDAATPVKIDRHLAENQDAGNSFTIDQNGNIHEGEGEGEGEGDMPDFEGRIAAGQATAKANAGK